VTRASPDVRHDGQFDDWLAHRAAATPDRLALVAGGRQWTFGTLDAAATDLARRLAAFGIGAGDRVATLLHNGASPALLLHAVLRLGATLVPLNTRLAPAEVAWQLADAGPRLLVVDARSASLARAADATDSSLRVVEIGDEGEFPADGSGMADDAPLRTWHDAHHPLALLYTSGTTGRPKAAILTVANFWWSAIGSALNLGTHVDDRWLAVLPLFHVGGLSILVRSAIYGIAAVVHDGFDAAAVNRAIDTEGVTMASVVSVTLQRLLDDRGDRPCPGSLRCLLLGGGPIPRALLERCAAVGAPVVQTYGLTETTSQLCTLSPADALRKLGSAVRPLYPNQLRIHAPDGAGVGEIVVHGPVVTAGYRNRPEQTARTIVDGWLHTGDVGRVDDEGFLYVLDRRDDLIVTGGENVYPAEVEAALHSNALVAEAAVVGLPDERWGHRVVAVVRLTHGAAPTDIATALRAQCRAVLAGYKVPAEVRVVTAPLPRTASGKLQRGLVRAALIR
jgi:O-succinylbenzoic acid--CoA ligase